MNTTILSKRATDACEAWLREEFDADMLSDMVKAGIIKQADGFLISMIASLTVDVERAMVGVTIDSPPEAWKILFDQVNIDCAKTGEQVVALDDVEYYADQIYILSDEQDFDKAYQLASAIAKLI